MKNILLTLGLTAAVAAFSGCGSTGGEAETEASVEMMNVDEMETPTRLAVRIDGMMCPNGCAATIQKECGKLAGMGISEVNYDEGKGYFTFDASRLSQEEVITCIENTNGGDHYTVSIVEDNEEGPAEEAPTEGDKATTEEALHFEKPENEAHA